MDDANDYVERLIGQLPVRVRRTVLWGECDPAQVVYTPRFADYAAAGFRWFTRVVLDAGKPTLRGLDLGTPMKSMAFEFHHVLRPDETFEMTVTLGEVRTRTMDVLVDARSPDGERRFSARMSPIFIDSATFASVAIPAVLRDRLERYKADCGTSTA